MNTNKQKLELTWIGKDARPRLEPRILQEKTERSYHAKHRVSDKDIFNNILIKGDNLLALKALEQEYTGKVKCIYIDPPFNTGEAFLHYDDGIEHSLWLSLIRDRLEILRRLLAEDGSLFVHIDDNELGYLIVLLDEIFGRKNRIAVVTFKQASATGHKSINPGFVSTSNFVATYAKSKERWEFNRIFVGRERDKRYGQFIVNREDHHSDWQFTTLSKAFANFLGLSEKDAKKIEDYENRISEFVLSNAESVIQLARPDYKNVSAAARIAIDESRGRPNQILQFERDGYSDFYLIGGQRILFYSAKLKLIDGEYVAGEPLTTIWDDILSNNIHKEGGVEFPKGKKPEGLLKRIFELSTKEGDLVLDSFGGSGTTAAVAQKMFRRWIMVELGDHCNTHIIPRLKKVIDGEDQGGITKAVDWQGGGGFRFYELAPSLLKKDKWDNYIINPEYNGEMLAEAMCKQLGFTYEPSDSSYWMHGHSTESDFLYVTTQQLAPETLQAISDEVGEDRTLLICCKAFRARSTEFPNLTLQKIPNAVLSRCEWDKDDYSLQIESLPMREPEAGSQIGLFGEGDADD